MSSVNRETYLFQIDKYGDISAYLDEYVRGQESYASAICLDVDEDGMRPFYLHLDDDELQMRHPGAVRRYPIQKPVRPNVNDQNFSNLLKIYYLFIVLHIQF